MKTFIINFETCNKNKKIIEYDLHINLWCLTDRKSYIFDFGFLIQDISSIKKIVLICPFDTFEVNSLNDILYNNRDLINLIFNHDRIFTKEDKGKIIINFDKESFILPNEKYYKLNIIKQDNRKFIHLNINDLAKFKNKAYFRIRLHTSKPENIIKTAKGFKEVEETIDFRVNDVRDNANFEANNSSMKIKNINYFIIRPFGDDGVNFYENQKLKYRNLEPSWIDLGYINIKNEDMCVYYKSISMSNNTGFVATNKFKYKSYFNIIILLIIFIAGLFSFISSFIGRGVFELIKELF